MIKEAQLVQQHQLYPGSQIRKQLDLTALTPSNSDEKVGKKPKVLNVIFSILIVVLVLSGK